MSHHLFTFIPGHEMEDDAPSVHLRNVLSVAQLTPIIDIRAWEENALWYDENCLLGPFLDVHSF